MYRLKTFLTLVMHLLKDITYSLLGLIIFLVLLYFITNPNYLGIGTNPDSPIVPISTFKFN